MLHALDDYSQLRFVHVQAKEHNERTRWKDQATCYIKRTLRRHNTKDDIQEVASPSLVSKCMQKTWKQDPETLGRPTASVKHVARPFMRMCEAVPAYSYL